MKHTNSQRGPDGLFARSDGPKAKRIEVWLQPEALSLLDTLCRQWSVGRGKAISHLLCHGPVAPAAWAELEHPAAPTPTPSAPQHPEPRFAIGNVVIRTAGPKQGESFTIAELLWAGDHWRCGIGDGTGVAESVLELAPAAPAEPESTPSGRFDFSPYTEPRDAKWEIHQADARAIGIKGVTGDTVRSFKAAHKLPQAQPLSPEALQLFRDEREAQARAQAGHARRVEQRITAVRTMLQEQPGLVQVLLDHCGSVEDPQLTVKAATEYLLRALPTVGIKPYRKLVPGLWKALREVIPAAGYDRELEDRPLHRAWFWGVILRLADLDGTPPADPAAFVQWTQLEVYQQHQQRRSDQEFTDAMGVLQGRKISSADARQVLGLPEMGTELTRKAINDAYKALAREHHPDAEGGDADRFQRLVAARERLLLEVG